MRSTKPSILLIALVYVVIIYVLEVLNYKVMFPGISLFRVSEMLSHGILPPMNTGAFVQLIQLAISLMSMMLGVGMTCVCLNVSRSRPASFGTLFDPFGMFFKFLWLNILMRIYIFLWTLLLVVPGIIAQYKYSMAVYILLDNPEYSASECIRLSKEMMNGKKLDLFVLDLSFIGWIILSIIPFVSLYVMPYMEITRANFYNFLSGCSTQAEYTVDNDNSSASQPHWDNRRDPWE